MPLEIMSRSKDVMKQQIAEREQEEKYIAQTYLSYQNRL